jgi:hypothetical protein
MNDDSISTDDPHYCPYVKASVPGFIKHVECEGARYHVLMWDSYGRRCSEHNCIVNRGRPDCDIK